MKAGWKQKLLLAWGLGIVAGTLYANFFLEANERELLFQEQAVKQLFAGAIQWKELFLYLCSRRLALFFFLIFVSLTIFGFLVLYGSLFSLGFSMSLLLSVITMNVGVKGIFYYGMLWVPQILFYGPAFWGTVCLSVKMNGAMTGKGESQIWQRVLVSHLSAVFLLLLLWILGIAAETWGNPWVLSLFIKK